MAPGLEDLIKSFGSPRLDLVYPGPMGVGINGALFDALMVEPHLALEARSKGTRVPVLGVTDCPESRIILDRICEDDGAMQQAGAILSGEVDGVVIESLQLLHLLPFVLMLPIGGIAAITEPNDTRRRIEVGQYLSACIATGQLPAYEIEYLTRIEAPSYGDWPGRLPGSIFLDAWLGNLPTVFQE